MILEFTIPGQPRPWQRANVVKRGKKTLVLKDASARVHQKWIALFAMAARKGVPRGWMWPLDERYRVMIDVWERDGRRADVDNLAKNVLDSCNRVLWDDDRQVDHLAVCRHPPDKANPRTVVRVERIPE